jgi:hypothetical protein
VIAAIETFAADAALLLRDLTKPPVAGHYPDSHLVGRVPRLRQRPVHPLKGAGAGCSLRVSTSVE